MQCDGVLGLGRQSKKKSSWCWLHLSLQWTSLGRAYYSTSTCTCIVIIILLSLCENKIIMIMNKSCSSPLISTPAPQIYSSCQPSSNCIVRSLHFFYFSIFFYSFLASDHYRKSMHESVDAVSQSGLFSSRRQDAHSVCIKLITSFSCTAAYSTCYCYHMILRGTLCRCTVHVSWGMGTRATLLKHTTYIVSNILSHLNENQLWHVYLSSLSYAISVYLAISSDDTCAFPTHISNEPFYSQYIPYEKWIKSNEHIRYMHQTAESIYTAISINLCSQRGCISK